MKKHQFDLKAKDFVPIFGMEGYVARAIGNSGTEENYVAFKKDVEELGALRYSINLMGNVFLLVNYNLITAIPYMFFKESQAARAQSKTKNSLSEKLECFFRAHY